LRAQKLDDYEMNIENKLTSTIENIARSNRGRTTMEEWQNRARYVLRHLDDPLALEWSPICHLPVLEKIAKEKYPNSVLPRGRALHEFISECLQYIENELNGHNALSKLKQFVNLIRRGNRVTKSALSLGVTPSYASRTFKRTLVNLLADKLIIRLHND
jgi:hypothetical protein